MLENLRAEIKTLHNEMVALSNKAKDEKRSFNAEENQKYDAMVADFEGKRATIERLENEAKREAFLNEVVSPDIQQVRSERVEANEPYSMQSLARYLKSGILTRAEILESNTTDGGGVIIPKTLQARIREELKDRNVIRQIATVNRSSTDTTMPIANDMTGFAWIDENTEFAELSQTFKTISVSAYKLGGVIKVSHEMLSDNVSNLESFLVQKMSQNLARTEEEAFINGDGNKKPKGLNNEAKTKLTLATNRGITSDEIIDALFTLKSAYRSNASWLVGDDFMKAIYKLTDDGGKPLWLPAISQGGVDTLLGKPVRYSSQIDGFGAGKSIAYFGDFSFYEIWDRENITFARLNELFSLKDIIGIKVRARLDALLTDENAVIKVVCP